MKTCAKCKIEKSLENFSIDRKKKDGKSSQCRSCVNIAGKAHYWANVEKYAEKGRKWKSAHPERYRNVDRNTALKRVYGISESDYEKILAAQDGGCRICGSVELEKKKKVLSIDHDHKTGKVRGILCNKCNQGLGMFKDSSSLLTSAIDYLTPLVDWSREDD